MEAVAKRQHVMAELSEKGDTKHIWDADNPEEVKAARKMFKSLTGKGFAAFYATGPSGKKGEHMRDFDPDAERIILVPPMQGG